MEPKDEQLELFARCASGFEGVLAQELKELKTTRVRPLKGGVSFFGNVEDAYRACLWSRVATRIQLVLVRVSAQDADELYEGARTFPWEEHVPSSATIAVQAHGENKNLRNTQFTALKVKDALCDRLRYVRGIRPSVDAKDPDFSVDVSLHKDRATLYLNLSGASLHKRGYREPGRQVEAPLKETLAAGMLLAAGWDKTVRRLVDAVASFASGSDAAEVGFVDPLCGSGTLAVEAALMAADAAPGLTRRRWGFEGWVQHDAAVWDHLTKDARMRKREREAVRIRILAGDADHRAVDMARENAARAGVSDLISFYVADAADLLDKAGCKDDRGEPLAPAGLLATNPPYGQRLLSAARLADVYTSLHAVTCALPPAWDLAVITPDEAIDAAIGESATRVIRCYNGPIEAGVRLYQGRKSRTELHLVSLAGYDRAVAVAEPASDQFAARLRKVAKERAKWARKADVSCYRIYDADLPDFAVAIDLYQGTCLNVADGADAGAVPTASESFVRIAEYKAPAHVDVLLAGRRFNDVLALAPAVLDVDPDHVFSKVRTRAKGGGQYREARAENKPVLVEEAGYAFEVDLNGYLDTGLFLDHRITRALVGERAQDARFLNLFAYTGTATVHAAGGGAASTTTVDLSHTYLDWAKRNMRRNGFTGPQHAFVRADVVEWLGAEAARAGSYDLVFCDPPTFSNSKSTERDFDVQRDHVDLIGRILAVLAPGGTIVFSCNLRKFKLDERAVSDKGLKVRNITADTIPHDFARTPRIHQCFLLHRA